MTAPAQTPGLLALLRQLERNAPHKPRIGRNSRLRDEIVRLGQDPFLAFPESEVNRHETAGGVPQVRTRFLGFFGPQGALPLNTTEEVLGWFEGGDAAFVAFCDILVARFHQLFYRSWADARAIAQFDRPEEDRFRAYLLSLAGAGTPATMGDSLIEDSVRAGLAGLFSGRVKSPVRLRQMLSERLDARIAVDEMVPVWLDFEPDALTALGAQCSTLGADMHLGARAQSVSAKICIHVRVRSLAAYRRFLPGGADNTLLREIVAWYLGQTFDVDVALWLPLREVQPAALGQTAELGWMACVAPPEGADPAEEVQAARFRLDLSPRHTTIPAPERAAA